MAKPGNSWIGKEPGEQEWEWDERSSESELTTGKLKL